MIKYYSIKEVSKRTGLAPSNIRYYESEGLIQDINRDENGNRRFGEQEIEWIEFLGKMREMKMPIAQMKMPIAQMKRYANLRLLGDATIEERMDILNKHKEYTFLKINRMRANMNLLESKLKIYEEMRRERDGK